MDETEDRYVSMENGADRRSDSETRRAARPEVDNGSGEAGTVSRDQKKVL
jgi:hypothetical protein